MAVRTISIGLLVFLVVVGLGAAAESQEFDNAGVFAYARHEGEVRVLLGLDGQTGRWADFVGRRKDRSESSALAAAREFTEETRGVYPSLEILDKLEALAPLVVGRSHETRIFLLEIGHVPAEELRRAPRIEKHEKTRYCWIPWPVLRQSIGDERGRDDAEVPAECDERRRKLRNVTYDNLVKGQELRRRLDAIAFSLLEEEITRAYFAHVPEMATYYGVPEEIAGPGLAGRLSQIAPQAEAAKRRAFRALIAKLEAVDLSSLSSRERVIHGVLLTQLESALAPARVVEYGSIFGDWGMWFVPYTVTQLSGPQNAVPKLLESQQPVRSAAEAEAYLARLEAYGDVIDQAIEKLEHDRALGVVPPDFILEKAIRVVADRTAGEPGVHPLVAGFAAKAEAAGLAPEWVERVASRVRDTLVPANKRLAAKLELLRAEAVSDAGIWRLPEGPALYQALILHMTDTTLTPREIHELGLAEVERITREMDALLRAEGYTEGSVGERMTALGEEERFLYPDDEAGKERLLADVHGYLEEIEPLLPDWFGTLPEQEVVVRRIPPQAEASSSGGYYDAPALDGSRPGIYWINLGTTAIWPSFSLATLSYHEANPGHHLQTAAGMGVAAPILQTTLFSNAFGEGWALYAEALAKEMGLYDDDPFGDLGRLQDELHRAVRLVVDTGMHALRWSRDEAIRYMVETEGAHPAEAEAEIDRYAVWPGQALGYKIGMLEIQKLRAEAERRLGERFDIREFHDELLRDGGVPLQVLEEKVERWVREAAARPPGG